MSNELSNQFTQLLQYFKSLHINEWNYYKTNVFYKYNELLYQLFNFDWFTNDNCFVHTICYWNNSLSIIMTRNLSIHEKEQSIWLLFRIAILLIQNMLDPFIDIMDTWS